MDPVFIQFSPAASRIFPGGDMRRLASGYRFTEGPVWDSAEDRLYFTDFQNNLIMQWHEGEGVSLYRAHSNRAIGLSLDAAGRIVAAESAAQAIAYADGERSIPIVGAFEGKKLNSPNDVVVSRGGDIFFTDPFSPALPRPRELDFNGVFRTGPRGDIRLLYDGLGRPNGIALSPDESVLYVNDTGLQRIFAFQLREDGSASMIGVLATLDTSYGPGAADGMKVDAEGNIYVTGPGGLWVISPGGAPLALLRSPEIVGNFCFGGRDRQTLFLTATSSVYALPAGIPGIIPVRSVQYPSKEQEIHG
jgi:gluconolactonase